MGQESREGRGGISRHPDEQNERQDDEDEDLAAVQAVNDLRI